MGLHQEPQNSSDMAKLCLAVAFALAFLVSVSLSEYEEETNLLAGNPSSIELKTDVINARHVREAEAGKKKKKNNKKKPVKERRIKIKQEKVREIRTKQEKQRNL